MEQQLVKTEQRKTKFAWAKYYEMERLYNMLYKDMNQLQIDNNILSTTVNIKEELLKLTQTENNILAKTVNIKDGLLILTHKLPIEIVEYIGKFLM